MRHILHADLDAFYASVEQLDHPRLRGSPVIVGGDPNGRGVVAAASYEARRFGICSSMPMVSALQKCPQAIRVEPRFDRYLEVSKRVMEIFYEITSFVEPLSLDEAYLDITDLIEDVFKTPRMIAIQLKELVKLDLELTISVGVATSKSVSKIASDIDKPDGLTVVSPGMERGFLAPLDVDSLWGIGPRTSKRLASEGIRRIGDLASTSDEWIEQRFGKFGLEIRKLSLGQDDRPIEAQRDRKSVSFEMTLAQDIDDPHTLLGIVDRLSQKVAKQLAEMGTGGRTVKIKLRLSDFTTFTRQITSSVIVKDPDEIASSARELFEHELLSGRLFRLVGVGVSSLQETCSRNVQLRLPGLK